MKSQKLRRFPRNSYSKLWKIGNSCCDDRSDKKVLLPIVKSQTSPNDSSVDKLAITLPRSMSVNRDSFSSVYVLYSGSSQRVAFLVSFISWSWNRNSARKHLFPMRSLLLNSCSSFLSHHSQESSTKRWSRNIPGERFTARVYYIPRGSLTSQFILINLFGHTFYYYFLI